MNQIWALIFSAVLGGVAVWIFYINKDKGYVPYLMEKQKKEKEENKNKILEALNGKSFGTAQDGQGRITNDDVQKLLGVSDKTVQRYFNELENDGKIKQVGQTGKWVYYTKC